MRRTLPLVAALAAVCIMTPAHAQTQTSGGYVGVGVMSLSTDNARDFAATYIGPGGTADESATGLKLYGGYQWPNRFGIEAGLYNPGTYEVRTAGAKSDEFDQSARRPRAFRPGRSLGGRGGSGVRLRRVLAGRAAQVLSPCGRFAIPVNSKTSDRPAQDFTTPSTAVCGPVCRTFPTPV